MRASARHCKDRRSHTDLTCLGCLSVTQPSGLWPGKWVGWTLPFPQPRILLTYVSCRSRAETEC